jgi:Ni2+-binding GTPase involved in maturation of urease and hydrogenase
MASKDSEDLRRQLDMAVATGSRTAVLEVVARAELIVEILKHLIDRLTAAIVAGDVTTFVDARGDRQVFNGELAAIGAIKGEAETWLDANRG